MFILRLSVFMLWGFAALDECLFMTNQFYTTLVQLAIKQTASVSSMIHF